MSKQRNTNNIDPAKRQRGSFLVLAVIALAGAFALTAPSAIAGALETSAEEEYDTGDLYDLKLSGGLGFTDNDINVLMEADCIASAGPDPGNEPQVSVNGIQGTVSVYPELYLYVKDAEKYTILSDEYHKLVNDASDHIKSNIEPSMSAAREQALIHDLHNEIKNYEENKEEAEQKKAELDEELSSLGEDYDKAVAKLESEQQNINKAKDEVFQNEKRSQASIESGKKNLSNVLDEVYSKSSVTESDLRRAQGLSNSVTGTERSLHEKYTNQWSALSEAEQQIKDDQDALKEQKEQREQEIAAEKEQLSQNAAEADAKIDSLNLQLDSGSVRWVVEKITDMPALQGIYLAHSELENLYMPAGMLIYVFSLAICLVLAASIISRNKNRIRSWRQRGLSPRIIKGVFVRRTALAAGTGALLGEILGDVVSPFAYLYINSHIFGLPYAAPAVGWLRSMAGLAGLVILPALAALLTFEIKIRGEKTKGS